MGVWTGTGFPAERAADWTASKTSLIWFLTFLYLVLVLFCPGRLPVIRHGLLPHWYRFNGIFQLALLFCFVPEMLTVLTNGWTESVCRTGSLYSGSFSGAIMMLFVFSKAVDLAETVLIIMDGRRPLAVHIIHHAVTLIYVWHSYVQQASVARWFVFANLSAHVVLYSYLSPKKFGLRPCWLLVATTQMAQLVISLCVCFTAQNVIDKGGKCDVDASRLPLDKFVCAVFIILFADFYHQKLRQMRLERDFQMAVEIRGPPSSIHPAPQRSTCTKPIGSCVKKAYELTKTGITPSNGSYDSHPSRYGRRP